MLNMNMSSTLYLRCSVLERHSFSDSILCCTSVITLSLTSSKKACPSASLAVHRWKMRVSQFMKMKRD